MGRPGQLHRAQPEGVVRPYRFCRDIKRPGSPGRFCLPGGTSISTSLTRSGRCDHLYFPGVQAMKNLLTDIAGVRVGHADDAALASGVTAGIFDKPAVAPVEPAPDGEIYIQFVNRAFLTSRGPPHPL